MGAAPCPGDPGALADESFETCGRVTGLCLEANAATWNLQPSGLRRRRRCDSAADEVCSFGARAWTHQVPTATCAPSISASAAALAETCRALSAPHGVGRLSEKSYCVVPPTAGAATACATTDCRAPRTRTAATSAPSAKMRP